MLGLLTIFLHNTKVWDALHQPPTLIKKIKLMNKQAIHSVKTMKGLKHGFYEIGWNTGGSSLASVGFDREGNNWYAPCNWTSGSSIDWTNVKWYLLILENDYKKKTKNIACLNQKVFI